MWLAEQIRDRRSSSSTTRPRSGPQLEAVDEARVTGELSDEEATELENDLLHG